MSRRHAFDSAAFAARLAAGLVSAAFCATAAVAWDVRCTTSQGGPECKDSFERVRAPWRDDPLAEHGTLLHQSIAYSGLPLSFLDPFNLDVYVGGQMFQGPDGTPYESYNPIYSYGVARKQTRQVYIQGMANLPDFAYTLADWSSGAETCPPDPNNSDPVDCHNYETHIGWLNSNHMVPQSRKWYEHLHKIALDHAARCKTAHDATSLAHRGRLEPYFLACEKLALVVEAVGQHYLQDSWALGHMWERWGGTEIANFNGNRSLGFAIGAFTGLIHGAKAMLDTNAYTQPLAPWDDPLNAPHPDGLFNDGGVVFRGVGDLFVSELLGSPGDKYGPQRRALFGCAVDGLRAVYAATAQVHGPLGAANIAEIDLSRSVSDGTCWNQRAIDRAMAAGMGIHNGEAPNAQPLGGNDGIFPLILAISNVAPALGGHPELEMDANTKVLFNLTASAAAAMAIAVGRGPPPSDGTLLAQTAMVPIAGVGRNSTYAKGDAATGKLPADYADPFPPWKVKESNIDLARRSVPLNLTFADANAADRCTELTTSDLELLRDAVSDGRAAGLPQGEVDARCGRCAQILAPHLRFGTSGNFDAARDAFCSLAVPGSSAFIYTGDPGPFTGQEPDDFASLQEAARTVCHCYVVTVGLIPTTTTMNFNQTHQFQVSVTGAPNTAVTWMATGGTISASGLYTATAYGTFTVKATSVADPTKFATATVTVVPSAGIQISPPQAAVGLGKSRVFSAVTGAPPFTWFTTGGGTITQSGVFTAGNVPGDWNVGATNASGTGYATVIVDPYVGVYKGGYTRLSPFLSGSNAQFGIGRFLNPRIECGFNVLCYNTGQVDLGSVVIGNCWFAPRYFLATEVTGYCEETSTFGGGNLVGNISSLGFYTWTLERTELGTVVEKWIFELTKQP